MMGAVLLLAIGAMSFVAWGIARAAELFVVRVHDGRLRVVRGRAPAALLADFRDVLQDVRDARVRAVVEGGRPSLRVRGTVTPEHVQRLRNVLGRFTTAQIRSARHRG